MRDPYLVPDTHHDVEHQHHISRNCVCAAFAHTKSLRPCPPSRRKCLVIRLWGRHTEPDTEERCQDGKNFQDLHYPYPWCVTTLPASRRVAHWTGRSGDHIFGLLPLLASRLNGAGGMIDEALDPRASGVLDDADVSHGPKIAVRMCLRQQTLSL